MFTPLRAASLVLYRLSFRTNYLFGLLVTSFLLVEAVGVGTYGLGPDELMVWSIAKATSLPDLLRRNTFEVHPPLEPLIRAALFCLSDDSTVLRSVYCVMGVVAILVLSSAAPSREGRTGALCLLSLLVLYPTIAHISILLRGYLFLLLFLSAAILLMSRICQHKTALSPRALLVITICLVAAGLAHVSGFILAPAVVVTAVACGQRGGRGRSICYLLVPLSVLTVVGGSFYLLQFAEGTGAATWRALTHSPLFQECAQFNALDTITTRILHLFSFVPPSLLTKENLAVSGVLGISIFAVSLAYALRSCRWLAVFSILSLGSAASAHLIGVYPLSFPRHMSFLIPAIFMPSAHFMARYVARFNLSVPLVACVVGANVFYAFSGAQFEKHPDFPVTQASNQTVSRKIFELGTQPSIVLSSRFGLLYLLMGRDKLRTFYMDPATKQFSLNQLTVLVCVDAFMWQTGSVSIERCIVDLARENPDKTNMLVWLASIGYTDNLLAEIRRVARQIGVVTSDQSSEGLVLFQMPLRAVKDVLFRISQHRATENHCTGPIVIEH